MCHLDRLPSTRLWEASLSIELSSVIVRVEDVLSAPVDDEVVILSPSGNDYLGLDEIGRAIYDLVEQPYRVSDLCEKLSRAFEATPEQISADVLPFLEELEREGIVRVVVD